jgi:hypothetical protein
MQSCVIAVLEWRICILYTYVLCVYYMHVLYLSVHTCLSLPRHVPISLGTEVYFLSIHPQETFGCMAIE